MNRTVDQILQNEDCKELRDYLREVFNDENEDKSDAAFEKELRRLTTDGKHPWDCKCMLHR